MIVDDFKELLAILGRKLRLPASSSAVRDELVKRCHGDAACADRLIRLEKERMAGLSDRDAGLRALERLKLDR